MLTNMFILLIIAILIFASPPVISRIQSLYFVTALRIVWMPFLRVMQPVLS